MQVFGIESFGKPIVDLGLLLFLRPRQRAVFVFLTVFASVLLWWLWIPPWQNRDWQPDVAVLPSAEFDGDRVTIRNIRNNDYRSETDYTVRYYDKTFDLSKCKQQTYSFPSGAHPTSRTPP